jgi:hypothetical protein
MADPGKSSLSQTLSLIISVLALLISATSLYQSNRAAHVTRDTVRPDIAVESVKLLTPWTAGSKHLPIEIVLRNHGPTGAGNVGAFVSCQIDYYLKGNDDERTVSTGKYALTVDRLAAGQGQTRTFPCSATVPKAESSKLDSVEILWLYVELVYLDNFTDAQNHYTDRRCFSLSLRDYEQNGRMRDFKPCEVYLHELSSPDSRPK